MKLVSVSITAKLNYLSQTLQHDIICAVHQFTWYLANPQKRHGLAIEYLCMYLNYTCKLGIKFKMDEKKAHEFYDDADFSGGFNKNFSQEFSLCQVLF